MAAGKGLIPLAMGLLLNNTINSDLIRGNIDTIILRALYGGDRYGYDIINEIEQRSSGKYKLKQPTLYSCLNRLENQGFIRSYWGTKSIGGRRKYYTLTDMGKELFIKNKTDWAYSKTLIDNLITDGDEHEFSADSQFDARDSGRSEAVAWDRNENLSDIGRHGADEEGDSAFAEMEQTQGASSYYDNIQRENVCEGGEEGENSFVRDGKGEDDCYYSENGQDQCACSDGVDGEAEADLSLLEIDERENTRMLESLLFGSNFNNYTKKLESEEYTPDKNIFTSEHLRADNYFNDIEYIEDEEDEAVETNGLSSNAVVHNHDIETQRETYYQATQQTAADFGNIASNAFGTAYQNEAQFRSEMDYRNQSQYQGNSVVFQDEIKEPPPKKTSDSFISYKTSRLAAKPLVEGDEHYNKDIIKIFEEKLAGVKKPDAAKAESAERPAGKDINKIFEEKLANVKRFDAAKSESDKKSTGKDINKIFEEKLAGLKQPKEIKPQKNTIFDEQIAPSQIVSRDNPEFYKKDQIQIRNFKRLQESTASLGDEIKIRSYEDDSARRFNEQYYFYSNRLKLRQYFILFCIILFEVILSYVAINLGLRKSAVVDSVDLYIYIVCVMIGVAFPCAAFLLNWQNPNKRRRVTQSFKIQMVFSIAIAVDLLLIIYFGNVFLGMPLGIGNTYYTRVIVSSIMVLNLPINTILFKVLVDSKRYSV